jgi:hypothetical protein
VKDVETPSTERSLRSVRMPEQSQIGPAETAPLEQVITPPAVAAVVSAPIAARETAKVHEREHWGREKKQPPAYEV